jgi:release factor glutamine methyltransferase
MATLEARLRDATAALRACSPTPRLDAEVLAMHVAGLTRTQLVTRGDQPLSAVQDARLAALVARRARGEPIAYLIGEREFWSMTIKVSPATLIPRPETEHLVEHALAHIALDADDTIVDVGTGSGAIALALARERPRARIIAVDVSAAALAVARENADRLGLKVAFCQSDWLAPLAAAQADMIMSNPPYVADDDPHLRTGDVRFEPATALRGGADGLDAIRALAHAARAALRPGGWLLLEHGYDQGTAVAAILHARGYTDVRGYADHAGHDRVTEGRAG